jgi:hypothetical protein
MGKLALSKRHPRLAGNRWSTPGQGQTVENLLFFLKFFEAVKCSNPHGDWRFQIFSNFIFSKFRVHLDLHIHRGNFCFIKH